MKKQNDYSAIDRMFEAQVSACMLQNQVNNLRPQAEEAVEALIAERKLPADYTGTLEYNGIKIVVRRPVSYTWEKNNNISDPQLGYYKSLQRMAEQLENELKKRRAEMKGVAKALELAYPNSESIKHSFNITLLG